MIKSVRIVKVLAYLYDFENSQLPDVKLKHYKNWGMHTLVLDWVLILLIGLVYRFLVPDYLKLKKTLIKRQEGKLMLFFFLFWNNRTSTFAKKKCTGKSTHFLILFFSPFDSLNIYAVLTLSAGEIKENIIDIAQESFINNCGIDTLTDNPN